MSTPIDFIVASNVLRAFLDKLDIFLEALEPKYAQSLFIYQLSFIFSSKNSSLSVSQIFEYKQLATLDKSKYCSDLQSRCNQFENRCSSHLYTI